MGSKEIAIPQNDALVAASDSMSANPQRLECLLTKGLLQRDLDILKEGGLQ